MSCRKALTALTAVASAPECMLDMSTVESQMVAALVVCQLAAISTGVAALVTQAGTAEFAAANSCIVQSGTYVLFSVFNDIGLFCYAVCYTKWWLIY